MLWRAKRHVEGMVVSLRAVREFYPGIRQETFKVFAKAILQIGSRGLGSIKPKRSNLLTGIRILKEANYMPMVA